MHPPPALTVSCDSLVEFTEDAAAFAQGEPEFVHGAAPAPPPGRPAATRSPPPRLPSDQGASG